VGVEEKSEPRALRVYLRHICITPPTLDRIVDSVKWREKAETEGETRREQGKGCKRRMMHHNYPKEIKEKGKTKRSKLQPRKNSLPKN